MKPGGDKKPDTSWGKVADWYGEYLGGDDTYQSKVILPNLLRVLAIQKGDRVLDLACGEGFFAREFAKAGARVAGADIAKELIEKARAQGGGIEYFVAPADKLAFAKDGEFDAVVCVLALQNIEDVPAVYAEARRVLRPTGKFAMTVWCGPDTSACFAAVHQAIKTHGHPDVSIPSGPDFHQFARRDQAVRILSDAGFSNIDVTTVDCVWDLDAPEDLFEIYAKGTVRVATMLATQPPQNLAAIRTALALSVRQQFSVGNRWRVPVPAALVSATA